MRYSDFNKGDILQLTATPDEGWHFDRWEGDIVSTTNPEIITFQEGEVIVAIFSKDNVTPPDPDEDDLIIVIEGNGAVAVEKIIDILPPDDSYYGREYLSSEADRVIDVHPNDIDFIDGETVLLTGAHKGTWDIDKPQNVIFLFENFSLDGEELRSRGFNVQSAIDCEFHSVNRDNTNCRIFGFKQKHVYVQNSADLFFDGLNILTPVNQGQTDGFYVQRTSDIIIANCKIIIRNENVDAHNDFIQLFTCYGDRVFWNNYGRQDNSKTKNAQGIFDEMNTDDVGNFTAQYNDFVVGEAGIVIRNKDNVRRSVADVRNNKVVSRLPVHAIWMNYPVSYNLDIREVNDVQGDIRID